MRAFHQVVPREGAAQGLRHSRCIDLITKLQRQRHDLQVLARQEHARLRDEGGVAAELHAVFRGAQHRGAYAFTRRQHGPRQRAGVQALAQGLAKELAEVAKVARLAAVDVLAHTARKHHAADIAEVADGVGEQKLAVVDLGRRLRQHA